MPIWPVASSRHMRQLAVFIVGTRSTTGGLLQAPRALSAAARCLAGPRACCRCARRPWHASQPRPGRQASSRSGRWHARMREVRVGSCTRLCSRRPTATDDRVTELTLSQRGAHCALPRSSASEKVLPPSAAAGWWHVKQGRPNTDAQPPRHGSAPCRARTRARTPPQHGSANACGARQAA